MDDLTADTVINTIPGIENKSYLELGVAMRATFDNVLAGTKVGVDIEGGDGLLKMTTDQFFKVAIAEYDVIYIDADHRYEQTVQDYNNAIRVLRPGGTILLHDLYPPSEEYTNPIWCGDAYKLLAGIVLGHSETMVLDHNYGLTVVRHAQPVEPYGPWSRLDYVKFTDLNIRRVTGEELLKAVAKQEG